MRIRVGFKVKMRVRVWVRVRTRLRVKVVPNPKPIRWQLAYRGSVPRARWPACSRQRGRRPTPPLGQGRPQRCLLCSPAAVHMHARDSDATHPCNCTVPIEACDECKAPCTALYRLAVRAAATEWSPPMVSANAPACAARCTADLRTCRPASGQKSYISGAGNLCREQRGTGFGQLALRRLLSEPERASGGPKVLTASAN